MHSKVIRLFVAPAAGAPMQEVNEVLARPGGLAGDRYGLGVGTFSRAQQVPRDLTLIAEEAIQVANSELQTPFTRAETRRNLVTRGLDLNGLVGAEMMIGSVRVQGVELCAPCRRPSDLANKPGFRDAFPGRGGLRVIILNEGVIHLEDDITLVDVARTED